MRYLLVQIYYYLGDFCLKAFEALNSGTDDTVPLKAEWLFDGYQYFMNKSGDLDIYEWVWKTPIK